MGEGRHDTDKAEAARTAPARKAEAQARAQENQRQANLANRLNPPSRQVRRAIARKEA